MRAVYIYQLFDKEARNPIGPMIAQVTPTAIVREILDQLEEGKSQIAKHPDAFVIYCLGTQDLDTGIITHYTNDEGQQTVEIIAEVKALAAANERTL